MYAIIKTGGKQYTVRKGDSIEVELLRDADIGSEVEFPVLFLNTDDDAKMIGTPLLENCSVKGIMKEVVKGKKVRGMKYKPRSSSQRKTFGHRQHYARVEIVDIVRN